MTRTVSVVINTYNRAESLALTLDGVRRLDHPSFEVVVVNGPSTDSTAELLVGWAGSVCAAPSANESCLVLPRIREERIDLVQDDLTSRYCWWLADLDRIFARNDELLSNYGIRVSRGMAWFNFSRLTDPAAADDAERSIRTSTGAFIKQVREPDWQALRLATRAGRLLVPERRRWPSAGSTP